MQKHGIGADSVLDQFCQGANGEFNRDLWVGAMRVIQIDVVGSEFLQRFGALRFDERGVATNPKLGGRTEFGGEEYLIAISSA